MSININLENNNNEMWEVSVKGELDVSTADQFKDYLHKLIDEDVKDLKLKLNELDYIDSTGLGIIIGVLKRLKIENKEIYIESPKPNVKKIFLITGLDKIFKMEG